MLVVRLGASIPASPPLVGELRKVDEDVLAPSPRHAAAPLPDVSIVTEAFSAFPGAAVLHRRSRRGDFASNIRVGHPS